MNFLNILDDYIQKIIIILLKYYLMTIFCKIESIYQCSNKLREIGKDSMLIL